MSTKSADDDINPTKLTRESAQELVGEIIEQYGREISALEILQEHKELEQFPSCVIDLAYEQYASAKEQGQDIPVTEFVRQFRGVEQSLYRIIEFDQVLRENPSIVEPIPDERWPRTGEEFQKFALLSSVGRGALSRVFLARHTQLGEKPVIVKVCLRGKREAELLGRLAHPSIGEVHSIDTDETTGLAAICMPYQTLCTMHHVAEWMDNERLDSKGKFSGEEVRRRIIDDSTIGFDDFDPESFGEISTGFYSDDPLGQLVAKWGVELCSALTHAHQKGVLHCDVKPGNVLILPDLSVRLLDFNLATSQEDKAKMAGGTPPFMAAEQLHLVLQLAEHEESEKSSEPPTNLVTIDERADVYGLCATLWHLIMGEPPFGSTQECKTPVDAANLMLDRQKVGLGINMIRQAKTRVPAGLIDILSTVCRWTQEIDLQRSSNSRVDFRSVSASGAVRFRGFSPL